MDELTIGGYAVRVSVDDQLHGDTVAMRPETLARLRNALHADAVRQFANVSRERLRAEREGAWRRRFRSGVETATKVAK